MTRIAVLPADKTGCGSFRLAWPAEVVRSVRPDWDIQLHEPGTVQIATNPNGTVRTIKGLDPRETDLIIIQRVGMPGPARFLEWAQENGTAVLVDADDAMWNIHRDNVSWPAWNQRGGMHWKWLDYAMQRADHATVTTPYLEKRYGKHGRCTVLPNRIPESVTELESARGRYPDQLAVGWMGFTGTHPHDLDVVGDAVEKTLKDTGACARVVGDSTGAATAWDLPETLVEPLGPFPLGAQLYEGMMAIDVGLVPLDDNGFNRGKSSLKAMEFSSIGVPVIASPSPANLELAKKLPILIAHSPKEWQEHMTRLLNDPDERMERGRQARNIVREKFTIEGSAEQWAESWQRALDRRASVMRSAGGRKRTAVPATS